MPCQTIGAGATTLANGVTTVDCQKQVRSWRLLRSLIKLLIPSCNRTFIEEPETKAKKPLQNYYYHHHQPNKPTSFTSSTITTGTIFGFRRGKVSLCIQTDSKSTNPILLLEFALPTAVLAREMQGGILRIALECSAGSGSDNSSTSLFSMPVWTMYCNGRKAGYAVKRRPSKVDMEALKLMNSVVVGAGVISGKEFGKDDELMYLRANFARVSGSYDSESFHLIDPDGSIGQELSIFLFRSR
ncbi:protein MIZU-KUSSEI 1 [Ricinus communis]|uniref:protein MIZU-KUSSEI 1 n=1 Tax=Ricinus communis TaxID=3988 RepID=UPI00201AC920|nr:protein MIZU-KUSSEI 1 [Ricinus communis]